MTINEAAIKRAVGELSTLRFFPADPAARAAVMGLLARMVETQEQLSWLVRVMTDQVGEWRGPTELRGVFCARFPPKDGVDAYCRSTPGFTPAELETRALAAHGEVKQLTAGASAPLLLLAAKPKREPIRCAKCLDTGRLISAGGELLPCSCTAGADQAAAIAELNAARGIKAGYRCRLCGSRRRGEGLRLVDGGVEFCECASAEYRARVDLATLNAAGSDRRAS